jgi:hypothetical protein
MDYKEKGYTGLKEYMGFVEEAYARPLYWPSVQPLYSRLRRSDPEVCMVRFAFASLARGLELEVEMPDNPNDADKAAAEFVEQCLDDMDGGESLFIDTMINNVPFFGWGVWEIVPGVRSQNWKAPQGDDWVSQYNDGAIGIRRLGWRDSSSFYKWVFADNGKVTGMVQYVYPHPMTTLDFADCLHMTFGDAHNPEGLSPLEAVWRLERIMYGLQIVQGIGFEHSAGYLDIKSEKSLTTSDKVDVAAAAKAITTAQEGNYAVWPAGFTGQIMDIPFSAAGTILETIKYYGVSKLQIFLAQWIALSATTGTGSQAAMTDSSSMFMTAFNAMCEGMASQADSAIMPKLMKWNPSKFAGISARPKITISSLGKKVSLAELGQILGPLKNVIPLGDEDFKAIRKLTDFLPENLPDIDETEQADPAPDQPAGQQPDGEPMDPDEIPEDMPPAEAQANMQARFARHFLAHPEAMNV